MYLSKVKLEEIKSKYPTLVLMDDDIADAFNMVSDILTAEADAIKEKEPYATASISRLEAAAYEVFSVCGDIENENFRGGVNYSLTLAVGVIGGAFHGSLQR